MIALIGASAIFFTALQASINAPTEAFRGCLKSASAKATESKVAPDGIEDYFKTECGVQMESLKSAVVAFRVKNGMAKKAAVEDADLTVEDYMAAPADRYRFIAQMNTPPKAEPAKPDAAQAPATPAAQPKP
jgi:hypothetical protein